MPVKVQRFTVHELGFSERQPTGMTDDGRHEICSRWLLLSQDKEVHSLERRLGVGFYNLMFFDFFRSPSFSNQHR